MHIDRQPQLDALGDATRRAIVQRLFDGPKPVGELASGFSVSRPAISHHLRVLKEANLVSQEAVGTRRLYRLNPEGFDLLRDVLDRFWDQALHAFKKKLEETEAPTDEHIDRNSSSKDNQRARRSGARVPGIHRRH
jgi:DNA-binding transcriptional ArsR family regulator